MPADQIDWPGIRANAVLIGVREAARQAGANLPPVEQERFVMRVLKRSTRQGWITRKLDIVSLKREALASSNAKPLSAPVLMSSDASANALAEMGKDIRHNLVKAAKTASSTFAERSGDAVIKSSAAFKDIVAGSSKLLGWEEGKNAGMSLQLGVSITNIS